MFALNLGDLLINQLVAGGMSGVCTEPWGATALSTRANLRFKFSRTICGVCPLASDRTVETMSLTAVVTYAGNGARVDVGRIDDVCGTLVVTAASGIVASHVDVGMSVAGLVVVWAGEAPVRYAGVAARSAGEAGDVLD